MSVTRPPKSSISGNPPALFGRSLTPPAPGIFDEAHGLLTAMAQALLTNDPLRQQIVIPAAPVEQDERSQVHELHEGVVLIDEQGVILEFNEAAEQIFEYARHGVLWQTVELLFTTASDDPTPAVAVLPGAAGRKRSLVLSPHLLGRRRNGTTLPLDLRVTELTLDGRHCFLLLVHSLLQQRKREQPLRAAEARYRALVEQIPAVTFMAALDQGDNEMYVSPQIEALLGYSQKEWLDDPVLWFYRLHPDDRDMWNQEFARGIAVGGPFRAECRVLARDGRVVWIHGEARLVRDDQGRPLFLQGIAFDITESNVAARCARRCGGFAEGLPTARGQKGSDKVRAGCPWIRGSGIFFQYFEMQNFAKNQDIFAFGRLNL